MTQKKQPLKALKDLFNEPVSSHISEQGIRWIRLTAFFEERDLSLKENVFLLSKALHEIQKWDERDRWAGDQWFSPGAFSNNPTLSRFFILANSIKSPMSPNEYFRNAHQILTDHSDIYPLTYSNLPKLSDLTVSNGLSEYIILRDTPSLKHFLVRQCKLKHLKFENPHPHTPVVDVEIKDCSDLKTAKFHNSPNIRRIDVLNCENLLNLSITECSDISQIFVLNCPRLTITSCGNPHITKI